MRRLVEELLWLARFDAVGKPPAHEPVDLGVLVDQAADRFAAPAEARSLTLQVRHDAVDVSLSVPPEWLDQLVGGPPRQRLQVLDRRRQRGHQRAAGPSGAPCSAWTTAGPGIPSTSRERIFDRFHRDTDEPGGAGLGLAIADAIVRATSGRWQIGTSPQGGARMAVSWPTGGGPSGG